MRVKKSFSIIELMTVVLIVLLLMSLTIPIFVSLKSKARSAICTNQLRQTGVMMTSYISSYDGYLPNWRSTDMKAGYIKVDYNPDTNYYYSKWTGHLTPFLEDSIKSFHRDAILSTDGFVYSGGSATPPKDPKRMKGYNIINEAFRNGGLGGLKALICPEIHGNTYDVNFSNANLGLQFPKINFGGIGDKSSRGLGIDAQGWSVEGSIPTTYAANTDFFGRPPYGFNLVSKPLPKTPSYDSKRIDNITDVGHKAFLIESGLLASSGHRSDDSYYGGGDNTETEHLTLSGYSNKLGKDTAIRDGPGHHYLNFTHDSQGEFWTTYGDPDGKWSWSPDAVNRFNDAFRGKACLVPSGEGYDIVSFVDPSGGALFASFFANPSNAGFAKYRPTFIPYKNFKLYDEPEFHYMVGKMNVLFGDGSVKTVDMEWLLNNRAKIAKLQKE